MQHLAKLPLQRSTKGILPAQAGSVSFPQRSSFSGPRFPSCSSLGLLQVDSLPLHKPSSEVPNILQNKNETQEKHLEGQKEQ